MKPRLRDYLTILIALTVIFLSGAGVGYLIGEKNGRTQTQASLPGTENESGDWEQRTISRLTTYLELSPDQKTAITDEIHQTSSKIKTSRNHAITEYYRHLLDLHDQIIPHLNPSQQEKHKKDRESLQQLLDSRFQSDDNS